MTNSLRPFRCTNSLKEMEPLDTTLKDPVRTKKYTRTRAPEGESESTDKDDGRPTRTGVENIRRPLQLI